MGAFVQDPDREYFEFDGGNEFSLSTKDCSEEEKDRLYRMVITNVIGGVFVPKQILPPLYHNLIMAEAIKGNKKTTILKYLTLELK